MARKSRKLNCIADVPQRKSSLIQVAAYVRLSLEDRSRKATSIENQQLIISSYLNEHPNFELYDTYIDSGVSGTTFERAGFQRMLRDAEAGVISCIIVKDAYVKHALKIFLSTLCERHMATKKRSRILFRFGCASLTI